MLSMSSWRACMPIVYIYSKIIIRKILIRASLFYLALRILMPRYVPCLVPSGSIIKAAKFSMLRRHTMAESSCLSPSCHVFLSHYNTLRRGLNTTKIWLLKHMQNSKENISYQHRYTMINIWASIFGEHFEISRWNIENIRALFSLMTMMSHAVREECWQPDAAPRRTEAEHRHYTAKFDVWKASVTASRFRKSRPWYAGGLSERRAIKLSWAQLAYFMPLFSIMSPNPYSAAKLGSKTRFISPSKVRQ